VSEDHKGFFVDLFVRASNNVAIDMYRKLGYDIYRTVNKYYSSSLDHSGEDAFGTFCSYTDMRKSLSRDLTKETSKPTGKRIEPDQL
jgi:N-terminal acetyltransferase B complex catalytic subunit